MLSLCKVLDLQIACLVGHGELVLPGSLLENVLNEGFTSLVGTADKGSTGAVEEAHVEGTLSPEFKSLGSDVFLDLHVALGWSHVLTEGDDINVNLAKFYKKQSLACNDSQPRDCAGHTFKRLPKLLLGLA